MPLYTYKCVECGLIFDAPSTLKDRHQCRVCECGAPAVKVPNVFTFVLKGPGFHAVDYPKKDA
jgi:putative FmdB family regulatory protein